MARRKTTQAPEDLTASSDAELIAQDTAEADTLHQNLAEIDSIYGDGTPYDLKRLINESRFYLQQSAEAMLESGKRLILIKEHEQYGDFICALEEIGLVPRAAQKMMQAALKFTGQKRQQLAHLGKSKMLELMAEDDEDLDVLAEGGTLAGQTLDEIDRMSVRDLQEALRKEKDNHQKDKEVHEKMLAAKDEKLNELDREIHKLEHIPLDERSDHLSQQLERRTMEVLAALLGLAAAVRDTAEFEHAPQDLKNMCAQSYNRVRTRLESYQSGQGALDDLSITPEDDQWMEQAGKAVKKIQEREMEEKNNV